MLQIFLINFQNQKTYKWGGLLSFELKERRADVFLAIPIPSRNKDRAPLPAHLIITTDEKTARRRHHQGGRGLGPPGGHDEPIYLLKAENSSCSVVHEVPSKFPHGLLKA